LVLVTEIKADQIILLTNIPAKLPDLRIGPIRMNEVIITCLAFHAMIIVVKELIKWAVAAIKDLDVPMRRLNNPDRS
jgi:hypothetical protein